MSPDRYLAEIIFENSAGGTSSADSRPYFEDQRLAILDAIGLIASSTHGLPHKAVKITLIVRRRVRGVGEWQELSRMKWETDPPHEPTVGHMPTHAPKNGLARR